MNKLKDRMNPVFRNDDVSSDTKLDFFKSILDQFDFYGYNQIHGVSIYGPISNPRGGNELFKKGNTGIMSHCCDHIENNKEIIELLNNRNDEIAAHGFYHLCYAHLSYEQQYEDMELCLNSLNHLFPNKKIKVFIPPFNAYNNDTLKICKDFGLEINGSNNSILIEPKSPTQNPDISWLSKTLRYHYWKVTPEYMGQILGKIYKMKSEL